MNLNLKSAPFNVELLPNKRNILNYLKPVTSVDIHETDGSLAKEGLFSTEIFGRIGDKDRAYKFAYIDMGVRILHPILFDNLCGLNSIYKDIYNGRKYATFNKKSGVFEASDQLTGSTGASFFMKHLPELKFERNESTQRGLRIDIIEKYRISAVYDFLLVEPAGLRDLEEGQYGNLKSDEINDPYRAIIGLSKTVDRASPESPFNDSIRAQMQRQFGIIYSLVFEFLEGKQGFTRSRFAKRKLRDGTRSVMSQMVQTVEDLDGPQAKRIDQTVVGLHQLARAALPYTILGLKHPLITSIFNEDGTGNLIDPKTLKSIIKPIAPKFKELYSTEAGVLSILKEFGAPSVKDTDFLIASKPVILIYRTKTSFILVNNIDELPEEVHADVKVATKAEVLYYVLAPEITKIRVWVTRYPFATENSIYPSKPYLKTTSIGDILDELEVVTDEDGVKTLKVVENPVIKYNEFPIKGKTFIDTMSVSPCRMQGLGSDNDGDIASVDGVHSDEAIAEVDEFLSDIDVLLVKGKFAFLLNTDLVAWGFSHYTMP